MTDKLTIHDCRRAGFCIRAGVKPACEALGFDFRTFVREGIPLSEFESIKDVNVQRAVMFAKERIEKDGR